MGSSGSRINTLCYEYNTNKLYSGDATGCITVWIVDNILGKYNKYLLVIKLNDII